MGQQQGPSRSGILSSSPSSHLLSREPGSQRRIPPLQTFPPHQDVRNPHVDDWKFYVATIGSEASRRNSRPQPSFVRTPSSLHQAISGQLWRRQTPQEQAHRPILMNPENTHININHPEPFYASSWVPPTPSSSRLPPPFVPLHTRPTRKSIPSISRSASSYTDQGGGEYNRSVIPDSDARHRYSGNTDYREQQSPYPEFRPIAPRTQSNWDKETNT